MREDNLPLVEFAAVEAVFFAGLYPGPNIFAVAAVDIIGNKINAVHAFGGQII